MCNRSLTPPGLLGCCKRRGRDIKCTSLIGLCLVRCVCNWTLDQHKTANQQAHQRQQNVERQPGQRQRAGCAP